MLEQDQPYSNHNGGCIKFGPDGYLYIGLGDGGSGGDPQGNGQKKNTFLAKILRIDVDNGDPYAVPSDNPFVNDAAYKPEIWTTGVRNPWRFSFDRVTGDLWIGDVGQNAKEEVDFQPAGVGGYNFGWKCFEGTNTYSTSGCQAASAYAAPAFEYANPSIGCSMTGGFVYRGNKYADLYGVYLNADYCSGRIWGTRRAANGSFSTQELANLGDYEFSSFGEDRDGELYVAMLSSGQVKRITELCSNFQVTGATSDPACVGTFGGDIVLTVTGAAGTPTFVWSNGQTEQTIVYLDPGTYTVAVKDGNNCIRRDTFTIESLSPAPPPISLVINTTLCNGDSITFLSPPAPQGYGYQWLLNNQDITDATNQTLTVSAAGSYSVLFLSQPCNSTAALAGEVQTATIDAPIIGVLGDSLYTDASGFYQWLLDGVPVPGATGSSHIAAVSGSYTLQIIGVGGCMATSLPVLATSTQMPAELRSFHLSPNPTKGTAVLEMQLSYAQKVAFRLADAQDRTVWQANASDTNFRQTLDLRALPAGTYCLTVQLETGRYARRMIKVD